jgi:monoamine oxidase
MPQLLSRLARKYKPESLKVSRRDVLKAGLAGSAGLLLSNCGSRDAFEGFGGDRKRIIVVGAGFAGLACAYELRSRGYVVTVLEARNRVGGRVLSFKDMAGGKVVEGGGELIGEKHVHPLWWQYAEKFKLDLRKIVWDEKNESPIIIDGKKITEEEGKKITEEMEIAKESLNSAAREVNAERPWETPNADALDAQSMGDWIRTVQVGDLAKKAIRAEFEGNEGVALERMSYLAFLAMIKGAGVESYWDDAETHRCAQGNQALADRFVKELGNRVQLGKPVVSIVTGNQRVMVTTQDGQRLTAEDVVLAVPPSVWNKIRFTPELPAALKPQMGVAIKYLAGVKKRFWKDAGLTSEALTNADISMTWEATEGQDRGEEAVLTCFSGGPAAERARSRGAVERDAKYRADITAIYADYPENATSARFMDWPADPWVMAAYSFGAPRQMRTVGPALHKGMDTLHFAGEHTSWAFPGYMEGGLHSGVAIAKRLAVRDNVV